MHPVQKQVNTLGIDCSIQRLTEYIFDMRGTVFQPRVLQLNLDNINRLPHSKYPDRKIGECASAGLESLIISMVIYQSWSPSAIQTSPSCSWYWWFRYRSAYHSRTQSSASRSACYFASSLLHQAPPWFWSYDPCFPLGRFWRGYFEMFLQKDL